MISAFTRILSSIVLLGDLGQIGRSLHVHFALLRVTNVVVRLASRDRLQNPPHRHPTIHHLAWLPKLGEQISTTRNTTASLVDRRFNSDACSKASNINGLNYEHSAPANCTSNKSKTNMLATTASPPPR